MTLKLEFDFTDFDLELDKKEIRKILTKVGKKTATRVRKRTKKAGNLVATGEMVAAIRFAANKGENGGAIFPGGPRPTADGHTTRRPITNYTLAKFHQADGRKVLHFEDSDREFFREQIETEINAIGERILAKEGKNIE